MALIRRMLNAFLGRPDSPGSASRSDDLHDSEIETLADNRPLTSTGGDADAGDNKSAQVDPYGGDRDGTDAAGYSGDTDAGDRKTHQADPSCSDSLGSDPRG